MCDLEGDIESVGLLLDTTVHISKTGRVFDEVNLVDEKNFLTVKGVYSCIGCLVEDILPLVGYRRSSITDYLLVDKHNRLLPYNEETVKEFNEKLMFSIQRGPDVCLVKEGDRLFGVLIDHHNRAQVLGTVTRVLPVKEEEETEEATIKKKMKNVLVVGADGSYQLSDSKTVNLDGIIKNGATVGVVSLDGFLLLQSAAADHSTESNSMPQLTLILSPGYLVLLKGHQIVWTRRQQQHPLLSAVDSETLLNGRSLSCKHSQVGEKQIFVATAGLLLPSKMSCVEQQQQQHHPEPDYFKEQKKSEMVSLNLLGTHNALLNYEAFRLCIATYHQHTRPSVKTKEQGQEDSVGGGDGTLQQQSS